MVYSTFNKKIYLPRTIPLEQGFASGLNSCEPFLKCIFVETGSQVCLRG